MDLKGRGHIVLAYILLATAAVVGVWFIGHQSANDLKDNLNGIVTALCKANRPTIQKENSLRDVQIAVNQDALRINLERGDMERADLSRRQIRALKEAKRHVPTNEECERDLIP